jgi:hypothetical protein
MNSTFLVDGVAASNPKDLGMVVALLEVCHPQAALEAATLAHWPSVAAAAPVLAFKNCLRVRPKLSILFARITELPCVQPTLEPPNYCDRNANRQLKT